MPRRNATSSPGLALAILVLLLAAGVFFYLRQQQAAPNPLENTADLVSDERILFGGAPKPLDDRLGPIEVLKNRAYIAGYSEARKNPLWVAYRVFRNPHPFDLPRPTGGFITDTRTSARVKDADFARTGYDRGHMAPNSAIARGYGPEAQVETFLLSNICPQAPDLNREVWEKLETREKLFADHFDEVWVIDGPIFGDLNGHETPHLASGIAVPEAFYKIMVDENEGRPRVLAVIIPQTVTKDRLPQEFVTSIQEIQKETHLDFLWKLPAAEQQELESKVVSMWSVN
jgi:endonuclease G, mitochondrial